MLNLNKYIKTKLKTKPTLIFKNCSYVLAHYTVIHNTTQTVLIIFPLIPQKIIIVEMMSTEEEGELPRNV